jgi:hypothetical protein
MSALIPGNEARTLLWIAHSSNPLSGGARGA